MNANIQTYQVIDLRPVVKTPPPIARPFLNPQLSIIDHQSSISPQLSPQSSALNPIQSFYASLPQIADLLPLPTPPPALPEIRRLIGKLCDQLEAARCAADPLAPNFPEIARAYTANRNRLHQTLCHLNEAHREATRRSLPTDPPQPPQSEISKSKSEIPPILAEIPSPTSHPVPAEPDPTPIISANLPPTPADPVPPQATPGQSPAASATPAPTPSRDPQFDDHGDEDLADAYLQLNENLRGRPSPLRKLSPQQQETLHQLLAANSSAAILKLITQPEPIGFGIQTNARSLRRFRQEYAAAAAERQHARRADQARQILNSPNSDENFHLELKRRIQYSLLLAETDAATFAPQIGAGLTNLAKLQKIAAEK